MKNFQSLTFWKKPSVILALILIIFFLKGVFLATLFPIFGGQDEARHYNTIQYLSEPEDIQKELRANQKNYKREKDNSETYRFSEEIKKTSKAADKDILQGDIFNTIVFSNTFDGINEEQINQKLWPPINYDKNPDITARNLQKLYHILGSFIEKTFSNENILVRFNLIRIFSVLLAVLVILISYFIAKNIGLSSKASLIITAIIAFQPRFSIYTMNINYAPLLFVAFALFTLGGILYLKKGFNWKNALLLITSVIVGFFTKGTAFVLAGMLIFLIAFEIIKRLKKYSRHIKYWAVLFFIIASILIVAIFYKYLPFASANSISEIFSSLIKYAGKSLSWGRFVFSAQAYWGAIGWVDNWFMKNIINIIWVIQTFSAIGIAILLFSKKKPEFLPEKKYIIFLLAIIIALQMGVRIADWSSFYKLGRIDLGMPGRYFIPNLTAHIILVFIGIGALIEKACSRFKFSNGEKYFEISLIAGLVLMMAFMFYMIFDVIVLRYYL